MKYNGVCERENKSKQTNNLLYFLFIAAFKEKNLPFVDENDNDVVADDDAGDSVLLNALFQLIGPKSVLLLFLPSQLWSSRTV